MSGTIAPIGTTGIETQLLVGNNILNAILAALRAGVAIHDSPPVYTVATLPATGAAGQYVWASNGRKVGEGPGGGTGVPAFFNPNTSSWYSYLSGVAVTA